MRGPDTVAGSAPASPTDDAEATQWAGLDRLEQAGRGGPPPATKWWRALWPSVAAIALALAVWQAVVWTGWKPGYLLPGPTTVLPALWHRLLGGNPVSGHILHATEVTLLRAVVGFAIALLLGTTIGVVVARSRILRAAVGSLLSGLQTMPSVAWLPLAVVLFQTSERAILFVLLIGATPSVANGVIAGIDNTPPLLLRAGRMLGARGIAAYRHVILPAALPGYVAGMKQGWAFAWRSLMAGELIVQIAHRPSLGQTLNNAANQNDYAGMLAVMIVILIVGVAMDAVVFGRLERTVLKRRGLGAHRD